MDARADLLDFSAGRADYPIEAWRWRRCVGSGSCDRSHR